MGTGRQFVAVSGVLFLFVVTPIFPQKIKSDYDKSNDFLRDKSYAIGKNCLLTNQGLDNQAPIDRVLIDSLTRRLQLKGFVLDEKHTDFRIKYEAGAFTESAASTQTDVLNGGCLPRLGLQTASAMFHLRGGLPHRRS